MRGVSGDPDSIGYFGYAYYMANASKLKALKIKGDKGQAVMPSKESILDGSYSPLSRPLYLYVKLESLKRQNLMSFLKYYLDNISTLADKAGYVGPTPDEVKKNTETLSAEKSTSTTTEK
ncbi:MAG: hypothetical protein ACKO85_02495 [Isosphaeraceae bacterium]